MGLNKRIANWLSRLEEERITAQPMTHKHPKVQLESRADLAHVFSKLKGSPEWKQQVEKLAIPSIEINGGSEECQDLDESVLAA